MGKVFGGMVGLIVVQLAIYGAIIYAIVHFVRKFW